MTRYWGVLFPDPDGPTLAHLPQGTWAYRSPTTGQWFLYHRIDEHLGTRHVGDVDESRGSPQGA